MSTAKLDPLEGLFNAEDEDGTKRHKAELAQTQSQHEMLKSILAAQDQLDAIRREYCTLRSLLEKIERMQPDKPGSRFRVKIMDELVRQEQSLNFLASSLTHFLE